MKTLYFECNMGAAGDMLMAALLELVDDQKTFLDKLNAAGIPGVIVTAEPSKKCGITGTRVTVKVDGREECDDHHHGHEHRHAGGSHDDHHHSHNHHHNDSHHHNDNHHRHDNGHHHHHNDSHRPRGHHHSSYHDIEHVIDHLNISDDVKKNAKAVYALIAEAESHAHGVPVHKIHFHEVGEMDAVADIVGVCMLIEDIAPDAIMSSPINTGSGHAHCAHGTLPVPAPATAHILRGAPVYSDGIIKSELCTPTGAALLKHFAGEFCPLPVMTIRKIAYGMGKKDFDQANCVRAYLGDAAGDSANDEVTELSCNLDDMTPEAVSFAQETLLREGALDVWVTSIGMKKGRMGIMLSCLCGIDKRDRMVSLIFKHTTTLGIRENTCRRRYTLKREQSEVQTPHGAIRIKTAQGYDVKRSKPEHDDVAKIALENDMSIDKVLEEWPWR